MNNSLKGPALAFVAFFLYSSHDALVKSLAHYSVFQIIFFAVLFSCVPFVLMRLLDPNPQSIKAKAPKLVILRSVFTSCALVMSFLTFSTLPLVEAYVLLFLAPVIVTINSIIFLKERVFLIRWAAMILSLAGVLVVLRPSVETLSVGHLFGLMSASCAACGATLSRKLGTSESSATLVLFQLLGALFVSGLVFPFNYQPMPLQDLGAMFLLGTLGFTAHYLMVLAYKFSNAAVVAPIQYMQIIYAAIFGYVLWKEEIDIYVVLGSVLIIGAGVVILWRESYISKIRPNLSSGAMRTGITATIPYKGFKQKKETKEM